MFFFLQSAKYFHCNPMENYSKICTIARVHNDVRAVNDWIAENKMLLNKKKKNQDYVHL